MTTAFLLLLLFAFLLLGMPVAFALGLSSVLTVLLFTDVSLASMALKLYDTMQHTTLLAIPFFVLASAFLTTGGVAQRMIRCADACVGYLRGGPAAASVLACLLFAAVSGSSPAIVIAVGSVVLGGMVRAGYAPSFAAGVVCNAGMLGMLIPPSIAMLVYAAATETSVGRLFIAGIAPGLLLALLLTATIHVSGRHRDIPNPPAAGLGEVVAAGKDSLLGLLLVVIVLGGIYGGLFTASEAAAVAAAYAFVVAVFVYRDLTFSQIPGVLAEAAKVTVTLLFILANAFLFAHVLAAERIPQAIAEAIIGAGLPPWMFLVGVNVLLLAASSLMEPSAILLILAPILLPVAVQLGIDPVHLGIIMVVGVAIGMVTPPLGLNLLATSGITGMSLLQVVRAAAFPWLLPLLLFLLLVTYVPAISMALPSLLY
jgi:C4-dicarboxylate transporter, DctM subunit